MLLEAEGRLGGSIHTFTDPETGAYVELGAHTLNSSYLATLDLLEELGLPIVESSRTKVLVKSKKAVFDRLRPAYSGSRYSRVCPRRCCLVGSLQAGQLGTISDMWSVKEITERLCALYCRHS